MPFKSEKQKKYLFANEPEMARRWVNEKTKIGRQPKEENRSKASGKAAYWSRGKEPSNGYEKEVTITPPGKKRDPAKRMAENWLKGQKKPR